MKILFITQKIDQQDDVLGVYHRWISELAFKVDAISAVCLFKGSVDLPNNVQVYSLGKEEKLGRWAYLKNFFRYIWDLRSDYDVVFVHMNPEYVILGGLIWRLLGKRVVLWYAHYLENWRIRLAEILADRVVTSTSRAFPFPSKKLEVLQQGIDTKLFSPGRSYRKPGDPFKILFLGRIAPVKNLDILVQAVQLASQHVSMKLLVVGAPTDGRPAEQEYFSSVKKMVSDLGLGAVVSFQDPVPNKDTPGIYRKNDLFVNLTVTGSFDKSTLEAMACETTALVSNLAFADILPPDLQEPLMFREGDHRDLAEKIVRLSRIDRAEREKIGERLRDIIVERHNLSGLVNKLVKVFRSNDH